MPGLNASLAVALSGLVADQGTLGTTSNNIANINTPGYSRERPVLETTDPIVVGNLTLGTGVSLKNIESVRDSVLESRIQMEKQTQGQLDTTVAALTQLQVSFSSNSGDIGTAISNFFDTINQLSTSPADSSLRQNVLTAANNVATAFSTTAERLSAQRTNLDASVEQTVGQINQLTEQIAQLNGQISNLESVGQNAGTFLDQRTQLIDQLSSLVDLSVIPSDNTLTLTTASGTALVAGQQNFQLSTQPDASGLQHVFSQGSDVTATITSGQLGGLLQIRDQQIPGVMSQLDTLASALAKKLNSIQTAGYDLNGNPTTTTNLFGPPPASGKGAAASMSVAITDPSLLAASSDGTVGDNGNAEAMYALRNQGFVQGLTPAGFYANIVFDVGNSVASAEAQQSASNLVLKQLNDQRASVSGVSLDEEAANLMRYQQAYAASAQVISTINSMMQTVINMKNS